MMIQKYSLNPKWSSNGIKLYTNSSRIMRVMTPKASRCLSLYRPTSFFSRQWTMKEMRNKSVKNKTWCAWITWTACSLTRRRLTPCKTDRQLCRQLKMANSHNLRLPTGRSDPLERKHLQAWMLMIILHEISWHCKTGIRRQSRLLTQRRKTPSIWSSHKRL